MYPSVQYLYLGTFVPESAFADGWAFEHECRLPLNMGELGDVKNLTLPIWNLTGAKLGGGNSSPPVV
jgi:hypothetical protein